MQSKEDNNSQFQSKGIEVKEESLFKLEQILTKKANFSLSSYQPNYVRRRISSRLRTLRLDSLADYLEFLAQHPEESKELISALTISVTSFFRDRDTFQVLSQKVVPSLLKYAQENQTELRLWSAGCCTGEEAYSLAIIFLEADALVAQKTGLRIWATDVNESVIQSSQKGIYPQDRLQNLPSHLLQKYFQKHSKGYQIQSFVRKLVIFRQENLIGSQGAGFEGLNLIMCRNLLIYLKRQEQMRLLYNLEKALRCGGYLVLGKAEFLPEEFRLSFEPVSVSERIYQKSLRKGAFLKAGGTQ